VPHQPEFHGSILPVTDNLRRMRLATAGAFFVQGLVFISLTTRLPEVRDEWELSEPELSGLLLMMVLLAGAGSLLAERLARRRDSATVLRIGLGLIAASLPTLAAAPSFGVFVAGLAGYGVGLGLVDASSNMQAVAVEHEYARPILPSFHGMWTLGGAIGAAIAIATAHLSLAAGAVWLAVFPLAALFAPYLRRDSGEIAADATPVPRRLLLMLGAAMVLFYMVDTAAATWGPTYLDETFAAPGRVVPLAVFPYLLATLAMRFAGDRLVARHGPVLVLRVGAVAASVSLAVVVLAPSWQVAVFGFTLLGASVAVIAPLSFSAAAGLAGGPDLDAATRQARVDAVIGRFNQFNYVGALLGAVMTGLVGADSLRVGFAVPMVLILLIWPLAPAFAKGERPILTR
jgi:MFS family permease